MTSPNPVTLTLHRQEMSVLTTAMSIQRESQKMCVDIMRMGPAGKEAGTLTICAITEKPKLKTKSCAPSSLLVDELEREIVLTPLKSSEFEVYIRAPYTRFLSCKCLPRIAGVSLLSPACDAALT